MRCLAGVLIHGDASSSSHAYNCGQWTCFRNYLLRLGLISRVEGLKFFNEVFITPACFTIGREGEVRPLAVLHLSIPSHAPSQRRCSSLISFPFSSPVQNF